MLETLWYTIRTAVVLFLLLLLVRPENPAATDERAGIVSLVATRQFNFLTWELETLWRKGTADLAAGHIFLDEPTRKALVLEYVARLANAQRLAAELERLYSDPTAEVALSAPPVAAALAEERSRLTAIQPLVEAIIEEQVAEVLLAEGFGRGGHTWPPVRMHITPLPTVLIVSPREEIRAIYNVPLQPGLVAPEREAVEQALFNRFDRAGYVTNIGGLGIYPAMIYEIASVPYLVDVTAHEWAHHWLSLYPVGMLYNSSADMRTINESAANVVGREVARQVLARYYPELVTPPAPPSGASAVPPPSAEPPPFDFRAEMFETRTTAEALLAEGRIEEAEAYMEERRQRFVANGYRLRVLNQAYFAFHGSYADQPGGAASVDSVGPLVGQLWLEQGTLRPFLGALAWVTTAEDLRSLVQPTPAP